MASRSADPVGRRALLGCGAAMVLLVGLLGVGVLGYIGGLVALWNLPAYRSAIGEVQRSQRAQALLGEPMSDGWMATIQLGRSTANDLLELRVQVPIHGPLRSATVFTVLEQQEAGFTPTSVLLDVSGEVVDLMARNEVEASEAVEDQRLALLDQIDVHIEAGELEEAQAAADRAVELDPRSADTWLARARVRALTGQVPGALEDADKALRLAPKNANAQRATATVHLLAESWEPCIEAATDHLRLAPRDGIAWTLRARCYAGNEQARQAIAGAREGCTRGDPEGCRYARELEAAPAE